MIECERLSTGNPRVGKRSKLQRVLEPTCKADSVHVVHHLPSLEEARIEDTFKYFGKDLNSVELEKIFTCGGTYLRVVGRRISRIVKRSK